MDLHHKKGIILTVISLFIAGGLVYVFTHVGPGEKFYGIFDGVPVLEDLFPNTQSSQALPGGDTSTETEGNNADDNQSDKDKEETEDTINIYIEDEDKNTGGNIDIPTSNAATQKGIELYHSLDFLEARNQLLQSQDQDPVALFYLGLIASYEENDTLAKSYFRGVTEKKNASEDIHRYASEILDSYTIFESYRDGKRDFLYTLLGKAYINVGQPTLGILKLKQATTLNPNYDDAWILLGTAYILSDNYADAEKALRNVTSTTRPEPSYYLGLSQFNQQKFDQAIISFRQSIDLGYTPVVDVQMKIADAFLALKQYGKALEYYMQIIKDNPNNPDLYSQPIWLNLALIKDIDGAFEVAQLALTNNPRSALAHNFIAWVALENNDLSTAKQYLDAAVTLDANLQAAYYNYGQYYEKISDKEHAQSSYRKAISIDPKTNLSKLSAAAITRLN